jgi:serine/threonine protein kinase
MNLEWSREQKAALVERYWARRQMVCPNDGALLDIHEVRQHGDPRTRFIVRCKQCGRNFWSSEIEGKPDPQSFEGKYQVVRELGKGGMGYVVLVRNPQTNEHFAAKKILPEFLRDPEIIRRFQREQKILRALCHNNVVAMHEFFLNEEGAVIVMDYMAKGNLASAINSKATHPSTLAKYFDDTVAGLKYIHSQGVVHRDPKPMNILIGSDDTARIADFGLAALTVRDSTPLTQQGMALGTFLYAAPEQMNDASNASAAADIYALGLTAYEIATRISPHFRVILAGLHPELIAALTAAFEVDPARRTISAEDISSALGEHLQS